MDDPWSKNVGCLDAPSKIPLYFPPCVLMLCLPWRDLVKTWNDVIILRNETTDFLCADGLRAKQRERKTNFDMITLITQFMSRQDAYFVYTLINLMCDVHLAFKESFVCRVVIFPPSLVRLSFYFYLSRACYISY